MAASDPGGFRGDPIAIIGIGCRFPGIRGPCELWRLLDEGRTTVGEIPAGRFGDLDRWFDPRPATPGKIMSRHGGFLEDIEGFDAGFFGIAPREADRLDPQQRLLLEVGWESIEDAGVVPSALAGKNVGVFVGSWLQDFEARLVGDPTAGDPRGIDFYDTTGSGRYALAGRLSYSLGLSGPSLVVDTACSSSLVAIHLACQSLARGESEVALAGGVNVILTPYITIAYSQSRMMAPDGRCKFGDARADGYVRSEGCGVVVLKPLSRALADGDTVYATIVGSAVNNDGRSGEFLTTPGRGGQIDLLHRAYRSAAVEPSRVHYVEAHGTGTPAGDPVELGALGEVLGAGRSADRPCLVGSIKTNLGHTEGAAGVAGLIKVALSLRHGKVPRSLHHETPNPAIDWDGPLRVPAEPQPWSDEVPGLAGVSAFGITGTNAHIVIERGPAGDPAVDGELRVEGSHSLRVLPLSAHHPDALRAWAGQVSRWLVDYDVSWLDACSTAARRREHHAYRHAFLARDREELVRALSDFAADETVEIEPARKGVRPVFVFPGQGSQWTGMARELLRSEPVFRESLEKCAEAMSDLVDGSPVERISRATAWDAIDVIQPTLFAIQVSLAALWRSWGIEPAAVVGHSMGEVAAAHVAGALDLADACRIICCRSRLLRRVSGQGSMAVVEWTLEEAERELAAYSDRLSLAVNNSPRSCVVSGDPSAMDELIAELDRRDVFCRRVQVDVASHSPQMDPLREDLMEALATVRPRRAEVPIYSTVDGVVTHGEHFDRAYWVRNLRLPVLFSKMVERLAADGHDAFVEISPHPVLLPAVEQTLAHHDRSGNVLPSMRRDEDGQGVMLESLGRMHALGHDVAWSAIHPEAPFVRFPPYAWRRNRHWFESSDAPRRPASREGHPLTGVPWQSAAEPGTYVHEREIDLSACPYLADHRVRGAAVLPAAALVEMALAVTRDPSGDPGRLKHLSMQRLLPLGESRPTKVQVIVTPGLPGVRDVRIFGDEGDDGSDTQWMLLAEGTVERSTPSDGPRAGPVIGASGEEQLDGAEHRRRMQDRGLDYGPAFRGVGATNRNGSEAIAEIALDDTTLDADYRDYLAYPPLVDLAFQVVISLAESHAVVPGRTLLPIEVDGLRLHRTPDPRVPHRVRVVVDPLSRDGDEVVGRVEIRDPEGALWLEVERLRFRAAERDRDDREDRYELTWEPAKVELPGSDRNLTWLLLADETGFATTLGRRLESAGQRVVVARPGTTRRELSDGTHEIDPTTAEHHARLLAAADSGEGGGLRVVHLWSVDAVMPDSAQEALERSQRLGTESLLAFVRGLSRPGSASPERLWIVTRGAVASENDSDPVALAQSPLWGIGRVVAHEHPELACSLVDLDGNDPETQAELLSRTLLADGVEPMTLLRDGVVLHGRIDRWSEPAVADLPLRPRIDDEPFHAVVTEPGRIDGLRLREGSVAGPGDDEVRIEVRAVGLNFINVLSVMGLYPGYADGVGPLGIECCGRVIEVGSNVQDVVPGDEVVAFTPDCFGSHAVAHASLVAPKPDGWTNETAASVPAVFLTVHYGLERLAGLSSGERVLIHSATGGVGLAAIQIANRVGADVFTTAGTEEKRDYLRSMGIRHVMDSRSLDFGDEVLEATAGEGVDVVLNSLSGAAIDQGLRVLRPFGRFVEIGKRDVHANRPLGLEPFRKGLSFHTVDLDRMARSRPAWLGGMLRELMDRFGRGELEPLPVRSFAVDEMVEAFRTLMQGRHVGKLVVSLSEPPSRIQPDEASVTNVRKDGTYLITGGLGGLGLSVASRLAERGAGALVLVGRSAPSEAARTAIAGMRAETRVEATEADVANLEDLRELVRTLDRELPPLRGVVHAAGVLDDAILTDVTPERLRAVLAPKLAGAWNLDRVTAKHGLDFFVMFSSVAALLGTPGQGAYAAANAFLDALAADRRRRGLVGTSIQWGPFSEVGLAAADARRGAMLRGRGIDTLTPAEGLEALERLLGKSPPRIAVVRLDGDRWCAELASDSESRLFSRLVDRDAIRREEGAGSALRETLARAEPGRARDAVMEAHLQGLVAKVLKLAAGAVDLDCPFKALGLDSLTGLELRNRLEADTGIQLPATAIWNFPTVATLAPQVVERLDLAGTETERTTAAEVAEEVEEVEGADDLADLLLDIERLSDEEVRHLLADESVSEEA